MLEVNSQAQAQRGKAKHLFTTGGRAGGGILRRGVRSRLAVEQ